MGLSLTGDLYILLMDDVVDGLANQKKVVDDILLYAKGLKSMWDKSTKYCDVFETMEFP